MDSGEQNASSNLSQVTEKTRIMITFRTNDIRFSYRVAGVILHNGRVLCQRESTEGFWFLPGGRAELGESSRESIQREIYEELGAEPRIERLLFIHENFFTLAGESYHEIALYFLLSLPSDAAVYREAETFTREETSDHVVLTYGWLPLDRLEQLPLYPEFLRKALLRLPDQTEHIIKTDIN